MNFFGLTTRLNITLVNKNTDFMDNFKKDIKPDQILCFDFFDSQPNKYYGNVSDSEFKIRSGYEYSFAQAKGIIKNDSSEIEIQVLGYNWFSLLWLLIIIGLGFKAIFEILKNENYGVFPILLITILLTLFFYYKLKRGIKSFTKTLEADFKKYNRVSD